MENTEAQKKEKAKQVEKLPLKGVELPPKILPIKKTVGASSRATISTIRGEVAKPVASNKPNSASIIKPSDLTESTLPVAAATGTSKSSLTEALKLHSAASKPRPETSPQPGFFGNTLTAAVTGPKGYPESSATFPNSTVTPSTTNPIATTPATGVENSPLANSANHEAQQGPVDFWRAFRF